MSEFDSSVMVALLPTTTYWCHIDLPHVTLVYAGEIPDIPASTRNELAKETLSISLDFEPFSANVTGISVFGDEDLVEVITLELTPELKAMRERLKPWNRSQYTDYKPHATIGPVGTYVNQAPARLMFDRILFRWGTVELVSDLF